MAWAAPHNVAALVVVVVVVVAKCKVAASYKLARQLPQRVLAALRIYSHGRHNAQAAALVLAVVVVVANVKPKTCRKYFLGQLQLILGRSERIDKYR